LSVVIIRLDIKELDILCTSSKSFFIFKVEKSRRESNRRTSIIVVYLGEIDRLFYNYGGTIKDKPKPVSAKRVESLLRNVLQSISFIFILYLKSSSTVEISKEGKRFYSAIMRKEICLRPLYDYSCTS